MHWIDWLIVVVPLALVLMISLKAQKYVKGVSDFLTAGRVAGRYVVAVAGGEAAMGLISLVAILEMYYNSGLGFSFWSGLRVPISITVLLTGYCIYRYRESRAMTMGQFLEMRYSRKFRILAACLQSISGVINYGIFPAVGARFMIYFCDLPLEVNILGMMFPTFLLVMIAFLSIAVFIVCLGGQLTIMTTDCIQGILSYPLYAIIVIYILMNFSWTHDMAPALLDRPPGMSMLNPFDISKLRTFNLFYIVVGIFAMIFSRMAWSGSQGYNAAALNAHEQKMGAVMGVWRQGFSVMMMLLLALGGFTFLNSAKFANKAKACRTELIQKVVVDVAGDKEFANIRGEINNYLENGVASASIQSGINTVNSNSKNIKNKELMRDVVKQTIASQDIGKAQTFDAIYKQMRVPFALKTMLPVGITGVLCAICIFLLVSTDTTYMHSWGSIIVQDIILPIRGKPFTPRQQLRLLRIIITGVALFALLFSYFFAQIDFIMMFFAITGAIWLGGAGACIVGGLYWSRGTTAAAFSSLIAGSSLATGGIIMQKIWSPVIYPWLSSNGFLMPITKILEGASSPFEPYIMWRVSPDKFPISSQEMLFITMFVGVTLYIVVSLLTCKEHFNMDRLLHRGKYRTEGEEIVKEKLTFKTGFLKILGINSEYTKGDKVLAWSVFLYSMIWMFGSFVVICIWNAVSPWSNQWWANWFHIYSIIVPCIVGVITTVWFTIGGTLDLRRMFRRLAVKEDNILDDGRVIGHVSADDVALVEKVDHGTIKEAHVEEQMLEDVLKKENDKEDLENLKHQLGEDKKQ